MRHSILFVAPALLTLAGCYAPQYGLIAAKTKYAYAYPDQSTDQAMASDTCHELDQQYPPAHTKWAFTHPTHDPFGEYLIKKMLQNGYAVREFNKDTQPSDTETSLKYVVDNISPKVWRVKLFIGNSIVLTRAYGEPAQNSGSLQILGPWTKEAI